MTLILTHIRSADVHAVGVFDQPAYIEAAAAHAGAEACIASTSSTSLAVLRTDRGLRTAYGYPQPAGRDLGGLARALSSNLEPVRIQLANIGPARALIAALGTLKDPLEIKPLCVAQLDGEDPIGWFERRAVRAVSSCIRRGGQASVSELEPWFGPFYRRAMRALAADPAYVFDDEYFAAMATLEHSLVMVRDEHGTAAATLWLFDRRYGFYHLGARRQHPAPVPGSMNLALLEGMRESVRRRLSMATLGGGLGIDADDGLLAFKRQMATRRVARYTFVVGGDGSA